MPEGRARPVGEVLGGAAWAGLLAGFAGGMIDGLWSWGPAEQFVGGIIGRLRFVGFVAFTYATAAAVAGVAVAALLLAMWRFTRLGDALRVGLDRHAEVRARDPRQALAGFALSVVGVPLTAGALVAAYLFTVPLVANRKVVGLVVIVAMAVALGAIIVAAIATLLISPLIERLLAPLAARWRPLSSPIAPMVSGALMIGGLLAVWAASSWETARTLGLRGPLVGGLIGVLAAATYRPGLALEILRRALPTWQARAAIGGAVAALAIGMFGCGASPSVTKASASYSGLAGPIVRTVRLAFDWDRDGYARVLGGGDCDDGDRAVHPGAPEIPDDGIDQNCIGGDATTPPAHDPGFAAVPATVPSDPRILLITIDTVRADHFGSYGYARPTTPNLDALANQGTLFVNAWAHAPSTRYSMPAILTGRYPLAVYYDTSIEGWPGLAPKARTIAEVLTERGLYGGAFTNYWYFDRVRRMDQGFAEYDNSNAARHAAVADAGPEQTRGSSSKEQTDKAISFIDRNSQRRWFLWVHYYDPHYAYEKHPEVADFGNDRMALYDNELRYTDLHIGRLLDHLRSRGLSDNTIVVVTGDHGEGFGEHGVELHGYHLYAAQTKVPLIIRVPGLAARRATTPAGHVDILPTLANLVGGPPEPDMMGHSLVGVLTGGDPERIVFQQLSYENNNEKRGAASRDCHVIYNVSPDTSWEVYRIDRDPLEEHDLADDDDQCSSTRDALEQWFDREAVPPGAAAALLATRPPLAATIDAQFGEWAKLLGCEVPPVAKPGEPLAIQWTFEATARGETGWRVFVHLEGPTRNMINGDHAPARPFEWWQAGQFIRYTTTINLPRNAPSGRYAIKVGLFAGNHRAPVTAPHAPVADDAVTCATLEVHP